ncbi:MAG: PEP-CTERM sorting domain-containing protein [Pirellulales bacterium]|nr:PEP-CTERM sorting domain-containing protein [Pirellulales bacterium]
MPQWYFHDKADGAVSYDNSTNIVSVLQAAGGSPKLTLYDGGYGHDSWEPALRDEDNTLYPWLFSQTLVPEPSVWALLLLGAACFMVHRDRRG